MIAPGGRDRDLDEEFPLGDATADTEARAVCPYCHQLVGIALDSGSGSSQEYIEDCEVCCRPMRVIVRYDTAGAARVRLEAEDGDP
ncbi:hypothetical protein BH23GEM9_BH23GEM9_08700 [soil metagenome]